MGAKRISKIEVTKRGILLLLAVYLTPTHADVLGDRIRAKAASIQTKLAALKGVDAVSSSASSTTTTENANGSITTTTTYTNGTTTTSTSTPGSNGTSSTLTSSTYTVNSPAQFVGPTASPTQNIQSSPYANQQPAEFVGPTATAQPPFVPNGTCGVAAQFITPGVTPPQEVNPDCQLVSTTCTGDECTTNTTTNSNSTSGTTTVGAVQ
jgi:hypothetical protein